jgi:hypothetical protein
MCELASKMQTTSAAAATHEIRPVFHGVGGAGFQDQTLL